MSEIPVLEPEAVANLRAINPDDSGQFLRELVNIFLQDTPKRIAEMQLYIAQNRPKDLSRAAHALKGSAGNFGATRLVSLSIELEQMGRTNALSGAQAKLAELQVQFERTQPALESLKISP